MNRVLARCRWCGRDITRREAMRHGYVIVEGFAFVRCMPELRVGQPARPVPVTRRLPELTTREDDPGKDDLLGKVIVAVLIAFIAALVGYAVFAALGWVPS